MGKADQLTEKQAMFVREYLANGRNGAAAYRTAYNAGRMSETEIAIQASIILRNSKVAPIIEAAEAKARAVLDKAADKYAVSKERIVRELATMAFAKSRTYFDWNADGVTVKDSADLTDEQAAAVVEVSHTRTAEGGTIRVKLGDKRGALMDLARLYGYEAVRNVRIIKSVEELSDEELDAVIASGADTAGIVGGTRH